MNALHHVLQPVRTDVLVRDGNHVFLLDQVDAARPEFRGHQPVDAKACAQVQDDGVGSDHLTECARVGIVSDGVERHPSMT